MTVLMNHPQSFSVVDFLNALAIQVKTFTVVHPETGKKIAGEVLNLPAVGIALGKGKKQRPVGFPTPVRDEEVELFEIEVLLDFVPAPTTPLPAGFKGEAWEMRVEHAELVETIAPIANALSQEFGVTIILNPYSKKDDSAHLESGPVDPRFPDGPQVCRILKVK